MFYYHQKRADYQSSEREPQECIAEKSSWKTKLNSGEGHVQKEREGIEGSSRMQKNLGNYTILETKENLEEKRRNKILISVPKY